MKSLPVGIQSFEKLISGNYLYIDKTKYIYDLITSNNACFLSRPRRFGKSLLISTLEALFLGKKELFSGLWIEQSNYEWVKHPVIKIDFSRLPSRSPASLQVGLGKEFTEIADFYGLSCNARDEIESQTLDLIAGLYDKTGQKIAVLIDEYDSPIISNLNHPEVVESNQEILAGFYRTIKSSDRYLRFVFLTGVSRFSKVSVFSGLNNLRDISLTDEFADLLGYTQLELENHFGEAVDSISTEFKIDREALLADIKRWYNGYRFSARDALVYNPFSTLLFFSEKKFRNYWFETGTPTFLFDLIRKNNYDIRRMQRSALTDRAFNSYDVDKIPLLPVLYDTGYLTIAEVREKRIRQFDYILDYPNDEVRISFLEQFVDDAFNLKVEANNYVRMLTDCLHLDNLDQFIETIKTFFAEIPYDIQSPNRNTEAYYQSLIYCLLKLVGYDTYAEERTNKGRIDLVVEGTSSIYIFEMKVDASAQEAIAQIKKRGYAEKYRLADKKLLMVGLSFSSAERNLTQFEVEAI